MFAHRSQAAGGSLLASGILVAAALFASWSCTATRTAGGTVALTFAPDMVIHSMGLEDAKDQIYDLWTSCLLGTWQRPCTPSEIEDLKDSYDRIVDKKDAIYGPPTTKTAA